MMRLFVRERLGGEHRFVAIAAGDYDARAPYGLYQIVRRAGPVPLNPVIGHVPARLRRRIGLMIKIKIDAVLDAFGGPQLGR